MKEKHRRPQLNMAVDDEFVQAVADLQRMDQSGKVPSMSQVVREAVIEKRDRLRQKAERRKAG